ncbi:hypothetical protein H2199_000459 [Coniosporium tulheliwenetii]|uniref:Uncharacterized protein n=1 Tax=Coniosporium tulheliwenetii TaxID=3383036 RepID=A0ACC2ZQ33_9PEZI|nr:hypothetical protein H2199_000459 [Cladosporium sp. JES 115]
MASNYPTNNPRPAQTVPPVDQYIFVQGGTTPLPASTAQDHMRQGRYVYDRFGHPIEPTTWAPNAPFTLQAATDRTHPAYDETVHPAEVEGTFVTQIAWIEDVERYNIRAQTFAGSTKYQGRKRGKGKGKAKQAPEYDNSRQGRVTAPVRASGHKHSPLDTSAAYGSGQQLPPAQYHEYDIRQQPDAEYAAIGEPGPTYYTVPHGYQPSPIVTVSAVHRTAQQPAPRPPPIYVIPPSAVSARPQSSHQPQEPSPRLRLSSSHPSMRR